MFKDFDNSIVISSVIGQRSGKARQRWVLVVARCGSPRLLCPACFAHLSGSHLLSRRPLLLLLLLLILLVPGSALAGAAPALWREGSLGGEEDGEGGGGD